MTSQFQRPSPPSPETTSDTEPEDNVPIDLLANQTTTLSLTNNPPMGFTENNSATYLSSGNPCLDFFFHIVPDTPPRNLIDRLQSSWSHDPLTTLKLICNLRGIRGTGKSDKEGFYTAALWLHRHHPKTLASNIAIFAEFGYFKDLLEIIYRIVVGPEVRRNAKSEWIAKKSAKGKGKKRALYFLSRKNKKKCDDEEMKARLRTRVPRERRIEENKAQMKAESEKARVLRKEKDSAMAKRAIEKYNSDADYRFLYDKVSMFFADMLSSDIDSLNSGDYSKISLAAKWCPSVDSSYDKATLICESIARKLYPRNSDEIDDDTYVLKVRNRLRKQILVPLHNALKLPEVYMSTRQWNSIPYERVASVAMRNYTDIFLQRDKERFVEYLEKVKVGDAKIAAGALLPHEIIASLQRGSGAAIVAELQWKRVVDDLLLKGKLTNCIAVCDVSGSMSGTPMEVSVALGLLVSETSAEPWKGHVITFSDSPQLHLIKGCNLRSKTQFIRDMDWGCNTDFQKVFDKILEVAVNGKLREEDLVQRVFVFSDMEFDQASANPWETDYQVIQRKFKACGYEKVPEIVFWNLRDSSATPVTATEKGMALLSGFSKNLLTLFLEEGGVVKPEDVPMATSASASLNPEATMEAAISGELYQKLVVCD